MCWEFYLRPEDPQPELEIQASAVEQVVKVLGTARVETALAIISDNLETKEPSVGDQVLLPCCRRCMQHGGEIMNSFPTVLICRCPCPFSF